MWRSLQKETTTLAKPYTAKTRRGRQRLRLAGPCFGAASDLSTRTHAPDSFVRTGDRDVPGDHRAALSGSQAGTNAVRGIARRGRCAGVLAGSAHDFRRSRVVIFLPPLLRGRFVSHCLARVARSQARRRCPTSRVLMRARHACVDSGCANAVSARRPATNASRSTTRSRSGRPVCGGLIDSVSISRVSR